MKNNVSEYLVVLDLRSINRDQEGLPDVVEMTLDRLPDGGLLKLIASAETVGIGGLLEERYRVYKRKWSDSQVDYEILTASTPETLDLTELEAPGPMERILSAGVQMNPGDILFARVPRVPTMLFPHLEARNLSWSVHEEPDLTALLVVRKEA